MPLITCADCGGRVSTAAASCPLCGRPAPVDLADDAPPGAGSPADPFAAWPGQATETESNKNARGLLVSLLLVVAVAGVVLFAALASGDNPAEGPAETGDDAGGSHTLAVEVAYRASCGALTAPAVEVRDGDGSIVGATPPGQGSCDETGPGGAATFTVPVDVQDAEFYQVIVTNPINGAGEDFGVQSRSELEANGWVF